MSETVNQETNATGVQAEAKTFTQEELNSIVADRLERERKKFEGYEDFKAKASRLDELEAASKTELQKATERAEKLESELKGLKKAEAVRTARAEVAKETGVPMELLTAETVEACQEQAKAILEFAKPGGYPSLKDGGEVQNVGKLTVKQQFAVWANSL